MTVLKYYEKHADEEIAYPIVLQNLGALTVSNLTGSSVPAGLTFNSVTMDVPNGQIIALVSGGVNGQLYRAKVGFDLSNGEHRSPVFEIKIVDD